MDSTGRSELLFHTIWDGRSCTKMAFELLGLSAAIVAGTFAIILVITWLYALRQPRAGRAKTMRVASLTLAAAAVVLFAVIGYGSLSGNALQRVDVASNGLTFSMCEGLERNVVAVAPRDIQRYDYRQRVEGARTRRLVDEILVTVRGRTEPLVLPLSLDPTVLNHGLLVRVVPREALLPWIASLRERNLGVPAALSS